MRGFSYIKLLQTKITEQQFQEVMEVENSTGSGYAEEEMREIWVNGNKNDNFVCLHNEKIVAHISYNPQSKRRNGSIFMVNLTVSPEYRKQGIAQGLILEACKYYIGCGNSLSMSTSVDKDNLPAINLYKKVGFEIMDPICEADEDGEQYILAAPIEILNKKMENLKNEKTQ